MRLSAGTRVGPYAIVSLIGSGGMGEVYRAVDTVLGRDVAIKVLPTQFARDPERLARFQREAKTLALLNHPNIATVHGFEQSSDAGSMALAALVMELVEGSTLADRVAQGRLALDDALPIARQIAEALEAAHEQGIVHRDLKPANIKLRPDGAVKVLDFGLAKAIESNTTSVSQANSPTLVSPATMTHAGVILGTAAYMSPEQARGKPVDRRTDIWAFGCVLFEMLTGARAFEGDEVSDTLAAILRAEPRLADLPSDTPPWIRRLIARCLQKDPRQRLQHIGDARVELAEAGDRPFESKPPAAATRRRVVPLLIAAAGGAAAAALAAWLLQPSPQPAAVSRFVIPIPASTPRLFAPGGTIALSPDGRVLVYTGGRPIGLLRRYRDDLDFHRVNGADEARAPFFSPDSAWIGFFAGGQLKKVPASGGVAVTICEAPLGATGAWGSDGTIVVARDHLYRVPATGGTLTRVVDADGVLYSDPVFVRDSAILVQRGAASRSYIEAVDLDTGARHKLIEGSSPQLTSAGDLLFQQQGGIWAIRFDVTRLAVSGAAAAVVSSIPPSGPAGALFATSKDGSLVYIAGSFNRIASFVWLDRSGKSTPALKDQQAFQSPRLSPDGTRVAVSIVPDIWVYELERGSRIRLTTEGSNRRSVWSADGAQIAFYSTPVGSFDQDLFVAPANGGPAKRLLARPGLQYPDSWSKDGRFLIFEDGEQGGAGRRDLWLLPIGGSPQSLLATRFYERGAVISPDGEWLAFVTDESGRDDVYVQPFPGSGPKIPVSTNGGNQPMWARSGRELFYREGEMLMSVAIERQPFRVSAPRPLFEMPAGIYNFDLNFADYDVAPDGRFLAIRQDDTRGEEIHVVLNFAEDVRRALSR
jgi:tRNA A-37 threonylcarbamoyl transferase component Bud32